MKLVESHDTCTLDSDSVLYWQDTICLQGLKQHFKNHGLPGALITTAHPELTLDIPSYYFPNFLLNQSYQLKKYGSLPEGSRTLFTHNFMCNKKYYWRSMMIKLVEWFKIDNGNYSWSGAGAAIDWSYWLDDLDRFLPADVKTYILQPVCLPSKFFKVSDGNNHCDESAVTNYGENCTTWNEALYPIFENSAISLITESIVNDNTCIFTEKTLYSVLGLTFPIWCVGYKQAEHWKNHGFDIFDDVIDHSYQYLQSPVQRCFESIRLNLTLLQDLDRLSEIRLRCRDRLLQNRARMYQRVSNFFTECLDQMPDSVQHALCKKINAATNYVLDIT
jgi:hypothetical protein